MYIMPTLIRIYPPKVKIPRHALDDNPSYRPECLSVATQKLGWAPPTSSLRPTRNLIGNGGTLDATTATPNTKTVPTKTRHLFCFSCWDPFTAFKFRRRKTIHICCFPSYRNRTVYTFPIRTTKQNGNSALTVGIDRQGDRISNMDSITGHKRNYRYPSRI
jgi:hypothetical protein